MEIRDARGSDAAIIAALHIANQRETYRGLLSDAYLDGLDVESGTKQWAGYLGQEGNRIFTAWDEQGLLGFAACKKDGELPGCLYLDSLHVAPEARGKGVGTALIRRAGRYAGEKGFDAMSVCIVRGNEAARRLYVRLGAVHLRFFTDHFQGTVSRSEKLRWETLDGL